MVGAEKTVLITGASRGIGLELAKLYSHAGARVIATARTPETATELQTLAKAEHRIQILALDVTKPASFAQLVGALSGQPIDLLVVNAGMATARGGLDDPANTPAAWEQVLATNVSGVFFTIQALAPNVKASRHGKIAIISSRMGSSQAARGSSYLYRASKAAAANLGVNLATELKPAGVAVGVYHPGWVKTDMGGAGADITVAESAAGLLKRFDHLTLATTGVFEDYTGAAIAY